MFSNNFLIFKIDMIQIVSIRRIND